MSTRAALADDWAWRSALFRETQAHVFDHLCLPETQKQALSEQQFRLREQAYDRAYPDRRIDIVTLDGIDVGAIQVDHADDRLCLVDIAIAAPQQRRGLGTALVRALQSEAIGSGLMLTLSAERNGMVLPWYQSLGFRVIGEADAFRDQMCWLPQQE
jgi:ribosomal protein S18 acetylase RimI-like enzyme